MFRDFIRVAGNVRCRRRYKEQVLRFVLSEVTWLLTYQVRMYPHVHIHILALSTSLILKHTAGLSYVLSTVAPHTLSEARGVTYTLKTYILFVPENSKSFSYPILELRVNFPGALMLIFKNVCGRNGEEACEEFNLGHSIKTIVVQIL